MWSCSVTLAMEAAGKVETVSEVVTLGKAKGGGGGDEVTMSRKRNPRGQYTAKKKRRDDSDDESDEEEERKPSSWTKWGWMLAAAVGFRLLVALWPSETQASYGSPEKPASTGLRTLTPAGVSNVPQQHTAPKRHVQWSPPDPSQGQDTREAGMYTDLSADTRAWQPTDENWDDERAPDGPPETWPDTARSYTNSNATSNKPSNAVETVRPSLSTGFSASGLMY